MKILLADDHAVLRRGLKQLLEDEFPTAKFGEASSTQETIGQLWKESWDLLVLDIFMPGRSGLEVLREVRQNHPKLPVLVLSSGAEEQLAVRVLQAGAAGYINKQGAPEQLVSAVKKVLAGGRYVSAKVAELLAMRVARPLRHDQLSDREFQVLQLRVAGKSIKEIAAELCISPKTVSTFHTRVFEKLQLRNDVELVRYALEHGLEETKERGVL